MSRKAAPAPTISRRYPGQRRPIRKCPIAIADDTEHSAPVVDVKAAETIVVKISGCYPNRIPYSNACGQETSSNWKRHGCDKGYCGADGISRATGSGRTIDEIDVDQEIAVVIEGGQLQQSPVSMMYRCPQAVRVSPVDARLRRDVRQPDAAPWNSAASAKRVKELAGSKLTQADSDPGRDSRKANLYPRARVPGPAARSRHFHTPCAWVFCKLESRR